jgi:hypothetical protein
MTHLAFLENVSPFTMECTMTMNRYLHALPLLSGILGDHAERRTKVVFTAGYRMRYN